MFQTFDLGVDKAATAGRVAALRAAMAEAGVHGYLIPRADAHQGEYVAPRDERLSWLTGFSGSAGIAVVLTERAALFIDGRYTLQAAEQVDLGVFETVPLHETPPSDWLAGALASGMVLAYDPWLHGKAEIDRIRKAAEGAGAEVKPLNGNLVDRIWEDQPPPPSGAVRVHPDVLSGAASADKRTQAGAAIGEAGAEAAVLSLPDSIAWLLNIRGSDVVHSPVAHGFAILHRDGQVDLAMDPDKISGEVRAHLGNGVSIHAPEALEDVVSSLSGPVLLDQGACPLWFAERLEAAGRDIVWGKDPCTVPKAQKNDAELAGMRAAHIRDGAAMVRFLHWLDTALAMGTSLDEITIVEKLESFRADGSDLYDISFDTICGSGPNGAIVHYRVNRASNRTLTPGELLLVDSGGQYADGTTDITRTLATGQVDPEMARHFTLVLKGMIAVSRLRWPAGLRGRDLDPFARAALWQVGLDYDHGTGHGVGACLNVHEGPQSLSRRGEAVLLPGMILSNEPGYYVTGSHGIRIENLVIIEEATVPDGGTREMLGFETITWCPIDRRLIDVSLLDEGERAWLDAYHAQAKHLIAPQVSDDVGAWLNAACAPL
ncbi:MAG: aminopeptidase P family protein [Pseudomonadota bacterium]